MPKYLTFFSYTSTAAKAMIERPTDRTAAVKALVESIGGKLESFYWMSGDHDGFIIASYPDTTTAAALSVAVASTGAVQGLQTFELFDHDAQARIVKAAKAAAKAYKAPTA